MSPPPPHDLEAEEIVLGAVLWGDVTAHALDLCCRDFWAPEHGQIFAAMLAAEQVLGDDLAPSTRLWVLGHPRVWPRVEEHRLRELLLCVPLWGTVEGTAARVRELSRRRWLIRHMQRIEHLLRRGERPSERLLRGVMVALREMI